MSQVYIGTSGFSYSHWGKGVFYPPDLPQKDWLLYYAKYFDTVEINATFYHQMKRETFENWRRIVGPEFVFSIKGSRFITHIKKLKDCSQEVGRFFEAAEGMVLDAEVAHRNFGSASDSARKIPSELTGQAREIRRPAPLNEVFTGSQCEASQNLVGSPRLASQYSSKKVPSPLLNVVLWQLPPGMAFDKLRLKKFLSILPKTFRYTFEFRNESWLADKIFNLLQKHNAAIVFQDYPDWPITEQVTADFVYLRFHGREALYSSCYTQGDLEGWAEKIRGWIKKDLDVYGYFNNDALGYAVENAKTLKDLCLKKR